MSRLFNRLKNFSICLLAVFSLVCGSEMAFAQDARPNVLLVIMDDVGTESIPSYAGDPQTRPNSTMPKTVTMDWLASTPGRSMRFTNYWLNPSCSASRSSLLTGLHEFRTMGGCNNFQSTPYSIAHALNDEGYSTAAFGKWGLTPESFVRPDIVGFDLFKGMGISDAGNFTIGFPNYYAWPKVSLPSNAESLAGYATTENVNDAIRWIRQKELGSDAPWFAWLAFNAAHNPFTAPPRILRQTSLPLNPIPDQIYASMIEGMDSELERLLGNVNLNDTTVIIIGDNGNPRPVSSWVNGTPNNPNQAKISLFQGGVHVPCIVYSHKTRRSPQTTNDALIHGVDFFATILDLADADVDLPVDSRSFAPYFNENNIPPTMDEHKWNYTQKACLSKGSPRESAIRDFTFKLHTSDIAGVIQSEQFFNLIANPYEEDIDPMSGLAGDILIRGNLTKEEQAALDDLRARRDNLWSSSP